MRPRAKADDGQDQTRRPRAAAKGYAPGRATRDALITTAQRLFADVGFDAVSLREISVAADSRNTGAAQYYFGDKEQLILAVFERQLPTIAAGRRSLLAEVGGSSDPVRVIVSAIIRPLADQIGESHFLLFLARFQSERVRRGRQLETVVAATFTEARDRLREHLPQLPGAIFDQRFTQMIKVAVTALADAEWRELNGRRRLDRETIVSDLITVAVAMMTAPWSAAGPAADDDGGPGRPAPR